MIEHITPPPLFLSFFYFTIIHFNLATLFLSITSGMIIGFSLGLIGGGGSILAVPLLTFVIGLEPHMAIGTSAFAVAVNAAINMLYHKKNNNNHVNIKKGIIFGGSGGIGTIIGSQIGLITPANDLLLLFALLMIIIAIKMLVESRFKNGIRGFKDMVGKTMGRDNIVILNKPLKIGNNIRNKKNLYISRNYLFIIVGFFVGLSAGYFGIGGGFLIVPAFLHFGMNISDAIGTSLLPVSIFGLTTASRYSISYQIDWIVSFLLIIGGIIGGIIGVNVSNRVSKDILARTFAITLIALAIYIVIKAL